MKLVLQIALGIILAIVLAPFALAALLGGLVFAPKALAVIIAAVVIAWIVQGHRSQGIRDKLARIWG